ncbi:MAG: hypothetical protein VYC50_00080 [Pseudomonadota bacterium]|nr:hypothetical protein [Gammaproteobacteria bacterium]MEE2683489.1 hypothetical protein [Pseudomonadota bacterium]
MTHLFRILFLLISSLIMIGCSSGVGLVCEDSNQYSGSVEMPPLIIPDDLSIPSEEDVLRIPEILDPDKDIVLTGPCLESSPDFYES